MTRPPPISTLVTGFGAFPGVEANPTAAIVARLRAEAPARLHAAVLPVSWARGPQALARAIDDATEAHGPPRLLLHLGVAASADRLRIESNAAAQARQSVDVDGLHAVLLPPAGTVTFDPRALVERLCDAGLPASVSDDAGAYLCNAIFGHGLRWAGDRGAIAAFLHVPMPGTTRPDASGRNWSEADLDGAVRIVLEALGPEAAGDL